MMVGPKKQDFWPKINILRIRGAPVRQKLGMILENKVVQKLKLGTIHLRRRHILGGEGGRKSQKHAYVIHG